MWTTDSNTMSTLMLVSVCCFPKTFCFVLDFSGDEVLFIYFFLFRWRYLWCLHWNTLHLYLCLRWQIIPDIYPQAFHCSFKKHLNKWFLFQPCLRFDLSTLGVRLCFPLQLHVVHSRGRCCISWGALMRIIKLPAARRSKGNMRSVYPVDKIFCTHRSMMAAQRFWISQCKIRCEIWKQNI